MNFTVHPAAADELRETAAFYSESGDQELGLSFISEFERALSFTAVSVQPYLPSQGARIPSHRFGAPTSPAWLLEKSWVSD